MESKKKPENTASLVLREDHSGGITTVTLNRPDQYNALSEELLGVLQSTLDEIAENGNAKVVILAASGKAFCPGHDLKQMRAKPDIAYYQNLFACCSQVMLTMARMPQVVIARVHGMATAAGCQLVAASDLAVASLDARFAVSGVNLGLFCSTPGVALSRNLSRKRAFDMLVTGRFIDASTAVEYGLVNQAVAADALDQAVQALAQDIARKPADTLREGKALFYSQLEQGLAQAYALAGETMACNMLFEDTIEGVDAFIEKRPPDWH